MPTFSRLDQSNQQAQQVFDQFSNPMNALSQFQKLSASRTPTLSDYLGMLSARGGSGMQASEQFEAAQQRSSADAFGQFQQFKLGSQQNALAAMSEMQQNNRLGSQMDFQDRRDKRQGRQSLLNNIIGGGLSALGFALGGPLGSSIGGGIGSLFSQGGGGSGMSQFQQGQLGAFDQSGLANWRGTVNR